MPSYFHPPLGLLAGMTLLGLALPAHAESQKKVVVDFEDFGTWRLRDSSGVKPGAWWPASVCLSGSEAAKYHDNLVGELQFAFDPAGKGPFNLEFVRQKMSTISGFLDGIEFDADARDLPVSLKFELVDGANKAFRTIAIPLSGSGWKHIRLGLNADTVLKFAECKFPARLKRVILEAAKPCEGSVLLDDITLTGTFTKKDQLSIAPVYTKLVNRPEEDITLPYRLRNARPEPLTGELQVEVRDFDGRRLLTRESSFEIAAAGSAVTSMAIGKLPIGAYEVVVTAKAGELETSLQDHFTVIVPNEGQPNQHPMWFGIGDQSSWQGDLENRRHQGWMKTLGADINRMELFPDRFEPEEGKINNEGWRKIIQGQADAGVDVMVLYSGTPAWSQAKRRWRAAPDLWPQFEGHAQRLGAFLKQFPNVTYLEMWNEPDLDFFDGTLDTYVEMFEHFNKGFKQSYPTLPITSGGVTIKHPKEKPGFSRGMYERAAGLYDIAAYHAHGPLPNNEMREETVEKWLGELGLDKPIFNTETGDRSLYTAEGRRRQAVTLVKKVVYSKSRPKFAAYFWFTLQDYWDMDEQADDSFGLVTSDNRPKAAFAAYNNLIAELANTTPLESGLPTEDLSLFAFKKDDGRLVYAGWPNASKSSGILWIETDQSITVSDMFGVVKEYRPLGGLLPVPFGDLPLYISGARPGEPMKAAAPEKAFVHVPPEIRFHGSAKIAIPVKFRNPTTGKLGGTLVLRGNDQREIAKSEFNLAEGEEVSWEPEVDPADLRPEDRGTLQLGVQLAGQDGTAFSFPVRLIETYVLQKVAALGPEPGNWPVLTDTPAVTLDRPEQVVELAYDPSIPAWKGPADLSVKAQLVHDDAGVRARFTVTDNTPGRLQAKDQMFKGDDVQLAISGPAAKNFAILDLGQSVDGPVVWCSQHPDASRIGQLNVPITVTRTGAVTTLEAYLPYDQLGISPAEVAAKQVRFTFLVNEDDGKGRVRWMEWTPGIARDRTLESLGYGTLE